MKSTKGMLCYKKALLWIFLPRKRRLMREKFHSALDQAEYEERYKALEERYENIKNGIEGINEKRLERRAKQENIVAVIKDFVTN
jgi:hypothetical protein